jgi:hypothetical protein
MMEEITKFGTPQPSEFMQIGLVLAGGLEGVLLEHAITPIQQYSYRKNSQIQL